VLLRGGLNRGLKTDTKPASEEDTCKLLMGWLDRKDDSGYRGHFVSGRKHDDLQALINNYSAPALARALRDREETLAECAYILCRKDEVNQSSIDKVQDILAPFLSLYHEKNPAHEEVAQKFRLPEWQEDGLFSPKILKRLETRLHRLPREISKRARKRACVILPLCLVNKQPCILFTQRSHKLSRHKGEVCFPGGMVDGDDSTIIEAGLRELREETGIHRHDVKVLGILRCDWNEVTSITGIAVTPIVGFLGDLEKLNINPDPRKYFYCLYVLTLTVNLEEVHSYFTVPIQSLLRHEHWVTREFSPPVFREPGAKPERTVWGLTGYILHRFMRVLPSVAFETEFARELSL